MSKEESSDKIVDVKKEMKHVMTIKLPTGTEVDVYEISPNVYKYVFKRRMEGKKEEGVKLIPEE